MHRDATSFGLENYCGLVNTFYKDCQSRPKKISKIHNSQRGEKRDENVIHLTQLKLKKMVLNMILSFKQRSFFNDLWFPLLST